MFPASCLSRKAPYSQAPFKILSLLLGRLLPLVSNVQRVETCATPPPLNKEKQKLIHWRDLWTWPGYSFLGARKPDSLFNKQMVDLGDIHFPLFLSHLRPCEMSFLSSLIDIL